MMESRLLMCLALLLAVPAPARAAQKKIAVLELRNGAELSPGETGYLTDLIRRVALALPDADYFVMTRENILEILPPGTNLAQCQGECEVETGKLVGADYVVSGDIIRFGTDLKVSMKVHDCATSGLKGSDAATAKTVEALEEPAKAAARRMFSALPGGERLVKVGGVIGGGRVEGGVTVDRGESIQNTLTDETGFLVIKTEPPGATISINGKAVGTAPMQLEQMIGRYVVVAEQGRLYHPAREELQLRKEGARVTLTLPPAYGSLTVGSSPTDAEVWLNGEMVGKTPYIVERKPSGRYELRVVKPLHLPHQQEIVVEDGKRTKIAVELDRNVGGLTIRSEPPGAAIAMDGEATGKTTPYTFAALQPGVHVVKLTLDGYGDGSQPATVAKGKTSETTLQLVAKLGILSVTAATADGTPCEGEVLVDGAVMGQTPWKGQLAATTHEVEVRCPTGVVRGRTAVTHNERQSLELTAPGGGMGSAGTTASKRQSPLERTDVFGTAGVSSPYPAWGHGLFWSGLAVVGMGGAFHALASSTADEYRTTGSLDAKDKNGTWSSAAVASYSIGGVAMLSGAAVWIFGPSDAEWARDHRVSLVPTPDGEGALLTFGGWH